MMRALQLTAAIVTAALLHASPASAAAWPMKYEGGTLDFGLHDKIKVAITSDALDCAQGKKHHLIPAKNVVEVNYGNDVHRRVGAAVGVGIVTLGVGALLLLVKTKKHYVGVVWTDKTATNSDTPKKGGIVFKVGKGEYRGFVAALEGLTGLKAVNADVAGPGGTSK